MYSAPLLPVTHRHLFSQEEQRRGGLSSEEQAFAFVVSFFPERDAGNIVYGNYLLQGIRRHSIFKAPSWVICIPTMDTHMQDKPNNVQLFQ